MSYVNNMIYVNNTSYVDNMSENITKTKYYYNILKYF